MSGPFAKTTPIPKALRIKASEEVIDAVAKAMHQVEGIMMPWEAMADDFPVKRLHKLRALAAIEAYDEAMGAVDWLELETGSRPLLYECPVCGGKGGHTWNCSLNQP